MWKENERKVDYLIKPAGIVDWFVVGCNIVESSCSAMRNGRQSLGDMEGERAAHLVAVLTLFFCVYFLIGLS